ncbi:MAG: SirB2 family protein [Gammaproteobacteria bacterium]|nr:SirB2 family protein [Gammaproteobacteria bacterium]MDH5650760.1 SirB2 family protein [Gammaproteobacteria bacterium]
MSLIKLIHITTVLISISGFVLRGILLLRDSPIMRQRWIKIVPHINDTILLVTGITLAVSIQQYPFVHGWLTAKVIALLVYIGLGFMTIRFAHNKQQRLITWLAAILVFAYMLGVAHTRQAFFFLS